MPINRRRSWAEARIEDLTEDAVLIYIKGMEESTWVPRLLIEDGDDLEMDSEPQEIYIATWWLYNKRLKK